MGHRPISDLSWVTALAPIAACKPALLSKHSSAQALRVPITMQVWTLPTGAPVPTRKDTYGWKPQLSPSHKTPLRAVGEVDLVRRLEMNGFTAYWVDSFGSAPEMWRRWARRPRELPWWANALDEHVRAAPEMRDYATGGIPDVIGFRADSGEYFFVEYKGPRAADPRRQDEINEKQDAWFRAAFRLGIIDSTSFAVAEWRPTETEITLLLMQKAWQSATA